MATARRGCRKRARAQSPGPFTSSCGPIRSPIDRGASLARRAPRCAPLSCGGSQMKTAWGKRSARKHGPLHSVYGYGLQCRWENGPAASEPCPQKRMTASWSGPYMGSTEYTRGSHTIARGQWQAPLGSSRGKPPDPAALALDHQAARHAPAKPSAPMSTTTRGNPPTRPPPRGTARRRQPRAVRGEFAKFLSAPVPQPQRLRV